MPGNRFCLSLSWTFKLQSPQILLFRIWLYFLVTSRVIYISWFLSCVSLWSADSCFHYISIHYQEASNSSYLYFSKWLYMPLSQCLLFRVSYLSECLLSGFYPVALHRLESFSCFFFFSFFQFSLTEFLHSCLFLIYLLLVPTVLFALLPSLSMCSSCSSSPPLPPALWASLPGTIDRASAWVPRFAVLGPPVVSASVMGNSFWPFCSILSWNFVPG